MILQGIADVLPGSREGSSFGYSSNNNNKDLMPMFANINRSWFIAAGLSAALALFIFTADKTSATRPNKEVPELKNTANMGSAGKQQPVERVAVAKLESRLINRTLTLYGQTAPDRSVTVKTELPATVVSANSQRGSYVEAGQELVLLKKGSLPAQLVSAEAKVKQASLDYQSGQSLKGKNLIAANKLPELEVALAQARSEYTQLKIDLENTEIKAPISGILNERYAEPGDYLDKGHSVAEIIDLNPLVVAVDIPQAYISRIEVGDSAFVSLNEDNQQTATIRYKSSLADSGTRTFRVELTMENPDMRLPAGLSVEANLILDKVHAFLISPAMLSLDKAGNPGLKWVNSSNQVQFTQVDIVKTETLGIWLGGIPEQARVIVRGHGFVKEGDWVQVDEISSSSLVAESEAKTSGE